MLQSLIAAIKNLDLRGSVARSLTVNGASIIAFDALYRDLLQ